MFSLDHSTSKANTITTKRLFLLILSILAKYNILGFWSQKPVLWLHADIQFLPFLYVEMDSSSCGTSVLYGLMNVRPRTALRGWTILHIRSVHVNDLTSDSADDVQSECVLSASLNGCSQTEKMHRRRNVSVLSVFNHFPGNSDGMTVSYMYMSRSISWGRKTNHMHLILSGWWFFNCARQRDKYSK